MFAREICTGKYTHTQISRPTTSTGAVRRKMLSCPVGRDWYRHQVTVSGSAVYKQQVLGSRYYATARTDCRRRVATWNVNTLYQAGKFDNLKREVERMRLDVVGVSEVRWTGSGHMTSDGWKFYYSDGDRHKAEVRFLLKRELAESVL